MSHSHDILKRYNDGEAMTDVVLDVLNLTSKHVVTETLEILPPEVIQGLRDFVRNYSRNTRVFRGPRPKMRAVRFVKEWLATADALPSKRNGREIASCYAQPAMLHTVPIGTNHGFRELQAHAESVLREKRYKPVERTGSISWMDPLIRPANPLVRFKLCNFKNGYFFGARAEWSQVLGIWLPKVGGVSLSVVPSPVLFRGDYLINTNHGRQRITSITDLFPPAGQRNRRINFASGSSRHSTDPKDLL